MRLYAYLKLYGNLTKSEVTKLFESNAITVNDNHVTLSYIVRTNDVVKVNNINIERVDFKYYLYYKPKGILSVISNKPESYIHHLDIDSKMVLAGRLDKDSHGLMILSNDGSFINDILTNQSKEKEYIVKLEHPVNDEFLSNIQKSYIIRGKDTKPIEASIIDEFTLKLILTDGKYRQIRTIVKTCGNYVTDLMRIRIDKFTLGDLKPGEYKEISIQEYA